MVYLLYADINTNFPLPMNFAKDTEAPLSDAVKIKIIQLETSLIM